MAPLPPDLVTTFRAIFASNAEKQNWGPNFIEDGLPDNVFLYCNEAWSYTLPDCEDAEGHVCWVESVDLGSVNFVTYNEKTQTLDIEPNILDEDLFGTYNIDIVATGVLVRAYSN